ncbi:thioredoxin family protein [Mucilaginibacter agri]|uniref:Thioredoxin family protein n=1 Tax=Mucilaginibacter agri TaxID=2695265 RepID=A0A965ZL54_9SPHI|nr:thioredoxin family protein [Mucilaginibacter agri]NCD71657.1 thioredoxin family protein [Mucilaginibacter agri]
MDLTAYQQYFSNILEHPLPPYDNPDYLNYAKLNWARQHRWLKVGVLNKDLVDLIQSIRTAQKWIIITEPWCGDAAHTQPFMQMLAAQNRMIVVDYQLRDSPPFLIEQYLTNGTRSIPKLIITDGLEEIATWGPRPLGCQLLYTQLIKDHAPMDEKKIALQKWYNDDRGESFQLELLALLNQKL